jgi:hypothetical protein
MKVENPHFNELDNPIQSIELDDEQAIFTCSTVTGAVSLSAIFKKARIHNTVEERINEELKVGRYMETVAIPRTELAAALTAVLEVKMNQAKTQKDWLQQVAKDLKLTLLKRERQ